MNTYEIQSGIQVKVKRVGSKWIGANIDLRHTTQVNTFTDQDIELDPDSIYAPVEDNFTARVKARFMNCGYYGFRRAGWLMLVPKKLVIKQVVRQVVKRSTVH